MFRGLTGRDSGAGTTEIAVPVFFDPAIMASLRSRLSTQVKTALAALTIDRQLGHLQALLAGKTTGDNSLAELFDQPLFSLAGGDMDEGTVQRYNPVQQNVPAWALFGMFFTAIPIGGGLLKERSSGIWLRLMSLPVSPLTLVGGKILAYLVICCCQFLLICLIGATLFPLLGLPAFTVSGSVGGGSSHGIVRWSGRLRVRDSARGDLLLLRAGLDSGGDQRRRRGRAGRGHGPGLCDAAGHAAPQHHLPAQLGTDRAARYPGTGGRAVGGVG